MMEKEEETKSTPYVRTSESIGGGGSICGPFGCCSLLFLCCCVLPAIAIGLAYYYANKAVQENGGTSLQDYVSGGGNWQDLVDNMDDETIANYKEKYMNGDDDTWKSYISKYMGGSDDYVEDYDEGYEEEDGGDGGEGRFLRYIRF